MTIASELRAKTSVCGLDPNLLEACQTRLGVQEVRLEVAAGVVSGYLSVIWFGV